MALNLPSGSEASRCRPYDNVHDALFYEQRTRVRLLCLDTYAINYATQKGGYTGFHYSDKKVWAVDELLDLGFVEIPWNGRGNYAVLDADDIIVLVMVGKPNTLTQSQSVEWDRQAARYAEKIELRRSRDERPFLGKAGHHSRGDYATVTFGVSYGGGRTAPSNTTSATRAEREIVDHLVEDEDLAEFAARGSDALETFFPLAHEHLCARMRELHRHHPHLKFPFKDSAYPACTMNCGPQSVSYCHCDGPDYPGLPGSIHSFGSFNPVRGGHLVIFECKIFIQFPAGTLALVSSSGLRHGNTTIDEFETRYSFTQYVSGHLIKWVAYGCRPAGQVPEQEKPLLDREMLEGWANQYSRMSNFFDLQSDRKKVFRRHMARRASVNGAS